MAAYRVTDAQLTALANTIRSKGGTNEALQFPGGFLQAIRAISGGGAGGGLDTSDADAAAGDIRSGKTAVCFTNRKLLTVENDTKESALVRAVRIYKSKINSHLAHGYVKEVKSSSVNC